MVKIETCQVRSVVTWKKIKKTINNGVGKIKKKIMVTDHNTLLDKLIIIT